MAWRISRLWIRSIGGLACGLALALAVGGQKSLAAEPANDDLVQRQIAAGEFAPAFERARLLTDPAARDANLADVARAQAAAGARGAAFASLGEMSDDLARDGAIQDMLPQGRGGAGGGVQPDFDSLIELITSTIEPESWDEAGGAGAIQEFAGGVFVDAYGTLQRVVRNRQSGELALLRAAAMGQARSTNVRRPSALRKVSLVRLEREVQIRLAQGKPISEEMEVLAGLQRITHVFIYPEQGDIVIAGPAGDWKVDGEGRPVDVERGRPLLRLDDLVAVIRQSLSPDRGGFGCSIDPTSEGLANAQRYDRETAGKDRNAAWLKGWREAMGKQKVTVFGIEPSSHLAQVLIEADYRMKHVVLGLEKAVPEVPSYLDLVRVEPNGTVPPMDVLRFWFALNYDAVSATPDHNAFALHGPGIKVVGANELVDARGTRVQKGKADLLTQEFAGNFTRHFEAIALKEPIYAELRNIFDLALIAALLEAEGAPAKANWHRTCFADGRELALPSQRAPKEVDSVANLRKIQNGKLVHTIAVVSGGVKVQPWALVEKNSLQLDRTGQTMSMRHSSGRPAAAARRAWWWD